MARRKIVFVIVEGASDETALGVMLKQVFDKDSVYVYIMHGDITTRDGINPQNIVAKVGNEIKTYAASNHYKAKDFKQIIHIVDTDAVYLSKEKIVLDLQCKELLYQSDGIHADNIEKAVSRNKQKRENLYRLRGCGTIWKIPYRVYYMSCNLDHVLYDKRNSTDEEKEQDAYIFARKYKNNVGAFMDFICRSSFSITGDYRKSWEFIEEDTHSIERYTNLPICLEHDAAEEAGKENV